jgi:ribonuclease Z
MIDEVQLISLGLGATIPGHRPLASNHVNIDGFEFLIDAPEGVQHYLFKHDCGLSIDAIFITNTAKRSLLGLPGLLNTLSFMAQREKPLTIYTPARTLSKVREVTDWYANVGFDINIKEVLPGKPIIETDSYIIDSIDNSITESYGLKIEGITRGEFNRDKAEALGVPPGPKYSRLCEGESVEANDGSTVHPEQVLDDTAKNPIAVVFSGRTNPCPDVEKAAGLCTVLVHDAVTLTEYRYHPSRASVGDAVDIASAANPDYLFLNRVSNNTNHLSDNELIHKATDMADYNLNIDVLSEGTTVTVRRDGVQISNQT